MPNPNSCSKIRGLSSHHPECIHYASENPVIFGDFGRHATESDPQNPNTPAKFAANHPTNETEDSMSQFETPTALVITDPQNDFLSPDGATWGMVGESVTENNTVENIESLLEAVKVNDIITTAEAVQAMTADS